MAGCQARTSIEPRSPQMENEASSWVPIPGDQAEHHRGNGRRMGLVQQAIEVLAPPANSNVGLGTSAAAMRSRSAMERRSRIPRSASLMTSRGTRASWPRSACRRPPRIRSARSESPIRTASTGTASQSGLHRRSTGPLPWVDDGSRGRDNPAGGAGIGAAGNESANEGAPRTLLDLLDRAFARYADGPAVGLWHDDGTRTTWTFRELDRRSRFAAWRLRHELVSSPAIGS